MAATQVSVPELFQLWNSNLTRQEICEKLGITIWRLYKLSQKHKLPKKPNTISNVKVAVDVVSPTAEEIKKRAAEIRKKWTPEEKKIRSNCRIKGKAAPWRPPCYRLTEDHFLTPVSYDYV
jgi:hypothetical protein